MTMTAHRTVARRRQIEGVRKQALDTGRSRLLLTGVILAVAFAGVAGRLVDLTVLGNTYEPRMAKAATVRGAVSGRANILDRNGIILATSLPTVSLSADPAMVLDADEAAAKLALVFGGLDRDDALLKLRGPGRFVWLARNLTPGQHQEVIRLGIPGLSFHRDERRVYPHGALASHVLGLTDVDGRGIAGIENRFDQVLRTAGAPVRLSLDLRVQSVLREELMTAMKEYKAIGATGLVMSVETGEVTAMVSLPDFNPNKPGRMTDVAAFNSAATGVYEMGSTFKLFTAAMALDSGTVSLKGGYDASEPIRIGRFSIRDYHAKNRWLSVPEIILHSSNIGAAKMAIDVGTEMQQRYLGRFGLLKPAGLELPEVGAPLTPNVWRPVNTMTISFGHGISVSPVQLAAGIGSLVNGGIYRSPTLLKQQRAKGPGRRVISAATSEKVRRLMRLVVSKGTGRKANVRGYLVGGKTGTAEKSSRRGYSKSAKISSFIGTFPMNAPKYVVLALLDEPVGNKRTFNYATGGWVAAPTVGRIIQRMAPMVGIAPDLEATYETPMIRALEKKTRKANLVRPKQPKKRMQTRAQNRNQKRTWANSVSKAVGRYQVRQTDMEERLVLNARHALTRAVAAKNAQKPLVSTALTALEQRIATR
ncbi:MAG: penicillin-binding protein 2 [Rhodospirillaceae bacterium]|nr:penicillin-binding protein 2 [Rhodospirillaceae bacterium]